MENGMEKKRGIFWIVFSLYTVLLVVAVVVINVKVWDALELYQNNYETAKEASNPDLIMPELMALYAATQIEDIAQDGWADEISSYELESNVDAYITGYTAGKIISFKRNEHFSDRKPVYDIYTEGQLLGMVTLKQRQESDDFGFHLCELKEAVAYVEQPETLTITVEVLDTDRIVVNGKELTSEYVIGESEVTSAMAKEAAGITGRKYKMLAYQIGGFLEIPTIEVYRNGVAIDYVRAEEQNYDYISYTTDEFVGQVEELVLEAGAAYVMNTNQWAGFKSVAQYIEAGSKAYQTVKSVQSGLAWAGKPDKVEIQESAMKDLIQYSEDVFTVKTTYKVYRLYRDVEYNEEVSYEWLYIRNGEEWKIVDFALAK